MAIRRKPLKSPAKTRARSAATIAPKKNIIQEIVPHPKKTRQKTISGLSNLQIDEWG